MPLYRVCPTWLEQGSIIRPGNYGRIVRQLGKAHPRWGTEQVLEAVRAAAYPDKPSRLTSAFGCENVEVARVFRTKNCHTALIYEVEPVDPDAHLHITDFNYIQTYDQFEDLRDMNNVAHIYWSNSSWFTIKDRPGLRCAETIIASALRVLREADEGAPIS